MTVRSYPALKTLVAALALAGLPAFAQQQPPAPPTAGPSPAREAPVPGNITIKRPSTWGAVGQPGPSIEERQAADPAPSITGEMDKYPLSSVTIPCRIGPRPKNLGCGPGQIWVDLDPSPKQCWACVRKPDPMD